MKGTLPFDAYGGIVVWRRGQICPERTVCGIEGVLLSGSEINVQSERDFFILRWFHRQCDWSLS